MFAKILKTHAAKDKSSGALASTLKIAPFFVKDYISAARNYSYSKVIQNISFLHKADLAIKGVESNQLKDGVILKQLVFELLH